MIYAEQLPAELTDEDSIEDTTIADEAEAYLQRLDIAYAGVLRRIAAVRLKTRRLGNQAINEDWLPSPDDLYELNDPIAEQMGRYLDTTERVARYRSNLAATALKKEQDYPFNAILDFVGANNFSNRQGLRDIIDNIIGGGIAKMPPGYGKTVMQALSAVAMGIGEHPHGNPEKRPKRALILVPSKRIEAQTIGRAETESAEPIDTEQTQDKPPVTELLEGFAGFAPHLKVAKFSRAKHKTQPNDCDIMTYSLFVRLVREGTITNKEYDVIFADEAHHLMGSKTREALDQFCDGALQVMALTATDKYSNTRRLSEMIRNYICNLDFKTEIEAGHLPPLQLLRVIARGPGIEIERRKTEDYTPKELSSLAHDDHRNQQILEWVEHFANMGKRIMVPTIAGNNCWHAQHLAEMIVEQEIQIFDAKLDAYRPLKAAVVGSFLGEKSAQILQQWDAGEFDVIFTVKAVNEGWNTVVDVVIDAAPTCSDLVLEQRIGRLTRPRLMPDGSMMTKIYITITDTIRGHKPQSTPWHLFEEDFIDPTHIIGHDPKKTHKPKPAPNRDDRKRDKNKAKTNQPNQDKPKLNPDDGSIIVDDLPQNLIEQLGPRFILVEEAFIAHQADRYKPPEPGWTPLIEHPELWHGMSLNGLRGMLERKGFPATIALGRRGPMVHASPDAIEFLSNYKLPPYAPLGFCVKKEASKILGVSEKKLTSLTEELDLELDDYRTRHSGIVLPHYSPFDINYIRDVIVERSTWQPGDVAIQTIAKEYGLSVTSIIYRLETSDPAITVREKTLPSGHPGFVISAEGYLILQKELDDTLITEENGRKTIADIMRLSGKGRAVILRRIRDKELHKNLRRGRYRNEEGHFETARFLEADDAEVVIQAEDWLRIPDILAALSCSPEAFRVLITMQPPIKQHRKSTKENGQLQLTSLNIKAVDQLKAYCAKLPQNEDWAPQEILSNAFGVPYESFSQIVNSLGLISITDRQLRRSKGQIYAVDIAYSPRATRRIEQHFNNQMLSLGDD